MREQLESTWDRIRDELRRDVPDFQFHIWIDPLVLAGIDQRTLFIRAPAHVRSWVRDRYLPALTAATARTLGSGAVVEIVDEDWRAPDAESAATDSPASFETPLNPKFTFEQFVIGHGSRFAHAAALMVAELPAQAYNPLFIHGRPGLGKSHLLHAIGNYIHEHAPTLTVRYATVEQFTTEFVDAIRNREMHRFKHRFRGVDVLLLDDVQFLADKTRTEEELFHTFNELLGSGRQLVMTSDRSPDELELIEDRLTARFGSGLVVEINPPDYAVRRAILEKRATLDSVDAPADLLDELAHCVNGSVRALEAALIQVIAYASLRSEAPTPALAQRLLSKLSPRREAPAPTVSEVLDATARHYALEPSDILARNRRANVARARKVAIYLARELTGGSLPELGREFAGRDHSTILAALRSLDQDMRSDPALRQAVENLKDELSDKR